jgi:hypothetical protein
MADRPSPSQALLTALAGVTAYEAGLHGEVLKMGAEDPGWSFGGAVALASRLAQEVRRLGGDPDELLRVVYSKAADLATS